MRGLWPTVAVAAAMFALAGCTGSTTEQTTTEKAPTPTATTPSGAPGGGFVEVVRAQLPEVAEGRTDGEIEAIAGTACVDLAAGKPADDIVAVTRSLGTLDAEATDQATARELIKLAIDVACPNQATRVDEF